MKPTESYDHYRESADHHQSIADLHKKVATEHNFAAARLDGYANSRYLASHHRTMQQHHLALAKLFSDRADHYRGMAGDTVATTETLVRAVLGTSD